MRISDWSSDVCSSDLDINWLAIGHDAALTVKVRSMATPVPARFDGERILIDAPEYGVAPGQAAVCSAGNRVLIGRASCRERLYQYGYISVFDVSLKKNILTSHTIILT